MSVRREIACTGGNPCAEDHTCEAHQLLATYHALQAERDRLAGEVDSLVVTLESSNEAMRVQQQRLTDLERVAAAAREYTTERSYYSREACVKDLDRLENNLLDALAALAPRRTGEGEE